MIDIVWLHTYKNKEIGGGSFMFEQINELAKRDGVNVEILYLHNLFNPYNFFKYLFLYRNKYSDKIIHAQYGSSTGFFSILLRAKARVISLKGSDWYYLGENVSSYNKLRALIAVYLTRFSLSYYDEIIVMSEKMRTSIVNWRSSLFNRITVIPDGIDMEKFYPLDKNKAKEKLGLASDYFVVGFGTFDRKNKIKRLWIVENAIKLLEKQYKVKLLVISGVSPSEMNMYLNACDLIALASTHEGWPNIIKEGLACNIPFISTDVSDLKIINDRLLLGCKVVSGSVESFMNGIESFIKEYNFNNLNASYRDKISFLSIENNVDKILSIYKKK